MLQNLLCIALTSLPIEFRCCLGSLTVRLCGWYKHNQNRKKANTPTGNFERLIVSAQHVWKFCTVKAILLLKGCNKFIPAVAYYICLALPA